LRSVGGNCGSWHLVGQGGRTFHRTLAEAKAKADSLEEQG
jgi:hypothetical protein